MFNIVVTIHILGVISGFFCLFSVMQRKDTDYKAGLVMAVCTCIVGVSGYIFELQAQNLREMILAIKIGYIGKSFIMTFALLFISKYYRLRFTKKFFYTLFLVDAGILAVIMTCEYQTWFYSSINLRYNGVFYIAQLGKTPFYYAVMAYWLLTLLVYVYLCFRQKEEKKSLESRIRNVLLGAGVVPLLFISVYLLGISQDYDICPLGGIICCCLMTVAVNMLGLFDPVQSAREKIVEDTQEGIFVVDNYYRLLYANQAAQDIFPELSGRKGQKVAQDLLDEKKKMIEKNGKSYEFRSTILMNGHHLRGYIVWLFDITEMCRYNQEILELKDKAEMAAKAKTDFLANMSHEIRTPMNAIIGMSDMALIGKKLPKREKEYIYQIKAAGHSLLSIINDILDFSKIESGKMEIVKEEYEIAVMINDLANIVEARIGKKDVRLLVDLRPDFPKRLYGDDIRIRQILLNLLNNAVKFTSEGAVSLKLDFIQGNLHAEVCDTGIGIKEEDMDKLFATFQQVDTRRNRSIEGSGLGLSISKQLAALMGGTLFVESIYGVGSRFGFDIPQEIIDETPCVQIKEKEKIRTAIIIKNDYLKLEFFKLMTLLEMELTEYQSLEEAQTFCNQENNWLFLEESCGLDGIPAFLSQKRKGRVVLIGKLYTPEEEYGTDAVLRQEEPFFSASIAALFNGENYMENLYQEEYETAYQAQEGRLLLVDDNKVNLKVAEGLLEPYHLMIDTALSGKEAIEKVKEHKYDIIFMDHMMPGMDGIETTHLIRKMKGEYFGKVPIIAFTANAVSGVKEMFLKEGMDDFIAKPIDYKELAAKVKKWLPPEKIQNF